MILGEKIIRLRKQREWSQEELASQLGISRQSVSKWESGASIPDLDKIIKMSSLFGVTTDYLLKEEKRWKKLQEKSIQAENVLWNEIGEVLGQEMGTTEDVQAILAKNEQLRANLLRAISHDLRTPLTSISGFAELMKNGMVPQETVPEFAGDIYREAQRLIALVEDIIHLSRLDEGAPAGMEPVDLYETARAAVTAVESRAKEKHVALSVSGGPASVMGVPGYLYEMVYNLCDNAIKYNVNSGSVEVSVKKEGNSTVLTVKDTGIGIPKEYQARVFQRFFRVDKSRSKASGGTGLGLSIVKHIAGIHGAEVRLSSRVGEGTLVSVVF